ncbi:MAG: DUF434 domain-containing protein [Bacteroidales bacterium]|nr:DUF434 domain-containing protein [Bacteroidales bacterium]
MKEWFPDDILPAAKEYLWMLSKGYPQKGSLKMVGDKFMLSRDMRQVLYRGISTEEQAAGRRDKIGSVKNGDLVLVDAYNVLFTINNYLLGKPLFLSNDGILRDAGEMRGRIVNKPVFNRATCLLLDVLREWSGTTFVLYLDEPVSYSGRLAIEFSKDMVQMDIEGEALTVKSPDHMLKHEKSDAICTSDSAIIDQYQGRIVDLPRYLLDKFFQPNFPPLIM